MRWSDAQVVLIFKINDNFYILLLVKQYLYSSQWLLYTIFIVIVFKKDLGFFKWLYGSQEINYLLIDSILTFCLIWVI